MDNLATSTDQIMAMINAIKDTCQEVIGLLANVQDKSTTTTPPPATEAESILITPQNYKEKLTNIDHVDFFGSTTEYVQINKDHNMLAVPCTYENLEVEVEAMVVSSTEQRLLQWQARGGRHSDSASCEGCAYKASFENTKSTNRKELFHRSSGDNGYCADKITAQIPYTALKGRYAKLKFQVINDSANNNNVLMNNYVDGKLVGGTIDKGDWFWSKTDQPVCPAREFGNTGNRKKNEKLNKAGVWVILRSDGDTVWRFKSIKVTNLGHR